MSALSFELPSQQSQEGPELFDVNEVIARALGLSAVQKAVIIDAYHVRRVSPYERRPAFNAAKLIVGFLVEDEDTAQQFRRDVEVDVESPQFPPQLVTVFNKLAAQSDEERGVLERFDFSS